MVSYVGRCMVLESLFVYFVCHSAILYKSYLLIIHKIIINLSLLANYLQVIKIKDFIEVR